MSLSFVHRFLREPALRGAVFLYSGAVFHFLYGVFRLLIGIFYRHFPMDTVAFFYLSLSFNRLFLIRALHMHGKEGNRRAVRLSGRMLFLTLGLLLLLLAQTAAGGRRSSYPLYTVLVSGGYAVASVFLAVAELFHRRRLKSPLLSASRAVGLTAALLSAFTFLSDLLFFIPPILPALRQALLLSVGAGVFLFVLFFAVGLAKHKA